MTGTADYRIVFFNRNVDHFVHQIKIRLEWHAYQVELIDDESECMVKFHQQACDLLLYDCPTSSAHDLNFIQRLADHKLLPPTIIINSTEDFQLATLAMQLGCVDYVVKDVLIQNFLDRLNHSVHLAYEKYKLTQLSIKHSVPIKQHHVEAVQYNWEYFPEKDLISWNGQRDGKQTELSYDEFMSNILQTEISKVKTQNNICLFSQKPVEYQFHYVSKNNQLSHYQAQIKAEIDTQGIVKKLQGTLKKLSTKQFEDENIRLKQVFLEKTTDALFVTDGYGKIVMINDNFCKITGYEEYAIINKPVESLNPDQYDDDFFRPMGEQLKASQFWQGELLVRHHQGHYIPVWQASASLTDKNGHIIRSISVFRDISRQKANEASIQFQANYDPLTQLPNRTLYLDRLANALKQCKRSNKRMALMLLDLDKFKWVNDNLGHHAGDAILVETAKKLQSAIRKSDTVARLAGDEFCIILSQLEKPTDVEIIVQKIFNTFKTPVTIDHQEIFISGSLGITVFPDDGEDMEGLQRNADSAMYKAKNLGRNGHYYYTRTLQEESEKRIRLLDAMRRAMENHEFSLHYQPIIDISTNKIAAVETFLRWKDPHNGYKSLDSFIPTAEESGLIRDIGNWTINKVAEHLNRWRQLGLPLVPVSLNQSVAQYYAADCCDEWLGILNQHDIPPNMINIEIQEKIFLEEKINVDASLNDLKKQGVNISLDGFGTGTCSLSFLQKFPIDAIKIDRSYIHNMLDDENHAVMVDTITNHAQRMGIDVIATGVENSQQLDRLKRQCGFAQGYYFSRPLPLDEFEYYLKKQSPLN